MPIDTFWKAASRLFNLPKEQKDKVIKAVPKPKNGKKK